LNEKETTVRNTKAATHMNNLVAADVFCSKRYGTFLVLELTPTGGPPRTGNLLVELMHRLRGHKSPSWRAPGWSEKLG
jgi:hypothetical protein